LLDGRKTQTRRVVKLNESGRAARSGRNWHLGDPDVVLACPYGQPGDRLWVKETHLYVGPGSGSYLPDYVAEARNPVNHTPDNCWYRADGDDVDVTWKPSIHMFRGLSRILLEIVGVRVDKLGHLTHDDAVAEGVGSVEEFKALWCSINGTWDDELWVWIVEFRKV